MLVVHAIKKTPVREDGTTIGSGEIFGYHTITLQYYDRYHLPIMHTETNMNEGRWGGLL